ncbi:n-alpha-acetyltransferase 38, NatC auxiliary subunit-like protein [Gongronella butleri]|nr:n-alpha-acetyltransferase 38, NatC auxiliary subunit-like protein [Gongronella butleri]
MSLLLSYTNQKVLVVAMDGRVYVGTMLGADQKANLILDKCQERVFSSTGTDINDLGLYVVRGDNVVTVGLVDEDADATIDFSNIRAEPLTDLKY